MNTRIFYNLNFFEIFNNFKSEKIGLYFSFCLHVLILMFAVGMPNFFKHSPIEIPNIIPIEIVNVSEITSIPKKIELNDKDEIKKIVSKPEITSKQKKFNNIENQQQKFNNIENQDIKNVKIKNKPDKKIKEEKTVKESININKNTINSLELKDMQKIIEDEEIESLPSKKIRPKIKPKPKNIESSKKEVSDVIVKNKPKPQLSFNIASMLKDLRNEQQNIQKEQKENIIEDENILNKKKEENKNAPLSMSEIDKLLQQLRSCWIAPAGAKIENWMIITIKASYRRDKRVLKDSVRIVDTNIPKGTDFYKPITESAMRTLLNPECNPLTSLPEDKYEEWKDFKINFDLRLMRGIQ